MALSAPRFRSTLAPYELTDWLLPYRRTSVEL